jgi:outer membrane protein OmpA-like peptidoglycan-associated protein
VAAQPIRREIVKNGKRTGRDTVIVPTLVVTWTPGDVVALRRPGTVSIADTYDYSGQMANTWIACKKWVDDNFNDVVDFADAILQGGDQVKARSAALSYACKVQAQVYNDANMGPSDWERYYRGVDTTDSQGNRVRLGGSRAWGLSDNVRYYGLNGGINIYEAVWNEFSRIMIEAMPERFESFEGNKPAAFSEVWNPSVINALYAKSKTQHRDLLATTSAPEFKESDRISQVVSNSKLTIEFEINSDRILPVSYSVLDKMVGSAASAENLLLEINGYTDNTGSSDLNRDLSQRRADAVKRYFLEKDPNLFRNRIQSNGYGDSNPVASNGTEAGRKKNRRVEILLGRK